MVTGNRTRPRHGLQVDTVLTATGRTAGAQELQPEAVSTLQLCRDRERTLAEVAARLGQPVLVAKIIVSDLIECGALADPSSRPRTDAHSRDLLEQLLEGIKALEVS
jgi:hypothetical protein